MHKLSWSGLRQDYLDSLRVTNHAPSTIRLTERWLAWFAEFCDTLGVAMPAGVETTHVDAFHRKLLWSQGPQGLYRPSTIDQALRAVRAWFRWAVAQQRLLMDPCRHLVLSRPPHTQPPLLTVDEVTRLLAVPRLDTPGGLRDRAALELLYATGMRRGECCALDLDDVNFDTATIHIRHGKGGIPRILPLGDTLSVVLQAYLGRGRVKLARADGDPAFLLSRFGTRYSDQCLMKLVHHTAQRANLPRISTHALRHAFAVHTMEGGADLQEIQALLGHRHPDATRIYTRLAPDAVAREHRRTHPRDKPTFIPDPPDSSP